MSDLIESYDALAPDPSALISSRRSSLAADQQPAMRLDPTAQAGRYILTAGDPDVQEILAMGLARSRVPERRLRDLVFTRQFTTLDRQNPLSRESPFHGFFTLFWLGMVLMFCKVSAENWRAYGSILGSNEVARMMFRRDVVILGLTDVVMLVATGMGLVLQLVILRGWISWTKLGWVLQNAWQTGFLAAFIGWAYYRDWPWTHTIFMVLHTMVFVMKQHSYAFTNGRLSEVYKRKQMLMKKLSQMEEKGLLTSGFSTPVTASKASGVELDSTSVASDVSGTDLARVNKAIESGKGLDADQLEAFARVMRTEIESLDTELKGKASKDKDAYPNNLTLRNFVDWTCLPTLVYELEYPRQDRINWWYVAEKTAATFGTIGVMMVISQAYIYPPVARAGRMKEAGMTLQDRWAELPWLISDMLFPLLFEQLLSWYVIWECVLNVLAELTRFADRGFYGPWWNSVSWDMYARDWNRPVHNFLLKHVYNSSISTFHLSKSSATFVTFLLSALVHELVMACLFKTVRGYLFTMQLMQMPLVSLSRSRLMKGRAVLGNVVFWTGLFIGPSVLTALYLLI